MCSWLIMWRDWWWYRWRGRHTRWCGLWFACSKKITDDIGSSGRCVCICNIKGRTNNDTGEPVTHMCLPVRIHTRWKVHTRTCTCVYDVCRNRYCTYIVCTHNSATRSPHAVTLILHHVNVQCTYAIIIRIYMCMYLVMADHVEQLMMVR